MSNLRVVSPSGKDGDSVTSQGTKVYVNGIEVTELVSLDLRWATGEAISAAMKVWAAPEELYIANADVSIVCEVCAECGAAEIVKSAT